MEQGNIYNVKNRLWTIEGAAYVALLCNKNNCRTPMRIDANHFDCCYLVCPDCDSEEKFEISYDKVQSDIQAIVRARKYKELQIIDIDGIKTPIAKSKTKSPDDKYFVTAQLMESKRGLQLAVYAGEVGKKDKTQIFIEPDIKRLAFDQTNLNPDAVFIELKATFNDGSSHEIKKKGTA